MVHEAVHALALHHLDAGGQHRVVRRRERQLVDDHQRERVAAHVDAFPETLAAHQHRIAGAPKSIEQFGAPALALDEQREIEATVGEFAAQPFGDVLDGAVGGA